MPSLQQSCENCRSSKNSSAWICCKTYGGSLQTCTTTCFWSALPWGQPISSSPDPSSLKVEYYMNAERSKHTIIVDLLAGSCCWSPVELYCTIHFIRHFLDCSNPAHCQRKRNSKGEGEEGVGKQPPSLARWPQPPGPQARSGNRWQGQAGDCPRPSW